MPTYALPPFCAIFQLPTIVYSDNHPGLQRCASDSHRKSNHLRYLVHLTAQKHVSLNPGNKQTDRAHREACRQADLFSSRWTRSISKITDSTVLCGLCSSRKCPSSQMAVTQHRPPCALAKGDRIFWYDQFARTRDEWCAAATRRSRS